MVKFYKKKLKNGMIVLFEKRASPVVSVAIATRFGGVNETFEERGIAHLIEHMLYKGTVNRTSKQISEEIEKKGGVMNAFTSDQITAYWCKLPSKHLGLGLDVLSDMVKNPLFDEKELEKEKLVILEEMKMWKDTPQLYVSYMIRKTLYKGILESNLIGTPKSLMSITQEKIRKKFEKVYATNNLILCVVGNADFKKICDFAEKTFPKTKYNLRKPKVIKQNKILIEKRQGIDQANLVFAYHSPKATEKKHYASQILSSLMAGGMSSRLFQEIREKRNLAYVVKGSCNSDKDFGYDVIYIGTTQDKLKLVKEIILQEFKKIQNLSEKELTEVKEQLVGNNKISKEDSQGQMIDLIYSEIFGDARESYKYDSRIKEVKLRDVKSVANFKNYSIFSLVPK